MSATRKAGNIWIDMGVRAGNGTSVDIASQIGRLFETIWRVSKSCQDSISI